MTKPNVRFSYHKDPKNPLRVVTVARMVEDGYMHVGWSINNPPKKYTDAWPMAVYGNTGEEIGYHVITEETQTPGDMFSKKRGRQIALGRLHNAPWSDGWDGATKQGLEKALHILINEMAHHHALCRTLTAALDELTARAGVEK